MPSRYTANMSIDDASMLAKKLNVSYEIISIEPPFSAFLEVLKPSFKKSSIDTTEENIQARTRGILLMAISNKYNKLVLTTGNKSEMSVGYATIYGDMAGGYAVIKDVPKTLVYKLASYRNSINRLIIPSSVLLKAPSAELKPNQKDQDYLPEYEVLDEILKEYIENEISPEEISDKGFSLKLVEKIISMVDSSEYKRQQSAPGIKITSKNFGRDRRMPISNQFKVN